MTDSVNEAQELSDLLRLTSDEQATVDAVLGELDTALKLPKGQRGARLAEALPCERQRRERHQEIRGWLGAARQDLPDERRGRGEGLGRS